jgi:hypothetical protein
MLGYLLIKDHGPKLKDAYLACIPGFIPGCTLGHMPIKKGACMLKTLSLTPLVARRRSLHEGHVTRKDTEPIFCVQPDVGIPLGL